MKGKQALNVFMPRWIQTYKKQNTKNKKTKNLLSKTGEDWES
jgi:hypothetical protein